jgi:hypothetical protein
MDDRKVAEHINEAIKGENPLYNNNLTVNPLPYKNGASPRDF